jgi:mannitol-1-phosphate 5-dehydrogenase
VNSTAPRTFVGFGFGAIQAGLFLFEAARSRSFSRLVVAEVVPEVVAAVRANGSYALNVAAADGVTRHTVAGIEILNPTVAADRERLVAAVAEAAEIATALPSVSLYRTGMPGDIASILAQGLAHKAAVGALPDAVIYTAENHNHAAELLSNAVAACGAQPCDRVQFLNTVIGKMSGVVIDPAEIAGQELAPIAPALERAFLVEAFNRILISRVELPGFRRGITVFEEKPDLLPFEHAKLYGHNAAHALLGYLLRERGATFVKDARAYPDVLRYVRTAFLDESGTALCRAHAGLDPLFTPAGLVAYADDLLERMLNPNLRDTVARVTRDPARKLGWDDRLIGTMRMALRQEIEPVRFARGAAAALHMLAQERREPIATCLAALWPDAPADEARRIRKLIASSG